MLCVFYPSYKGGKALSFWERQQAGRRKSTTEHSPNAGALSASLQGEPRSQDKTRRCQLSERAIYQKLQSNGYPWLSAPYPLSSNFVKIRN